MKQPPRGSATRPPSRIIGGGDYHTTVIGTTQTGKTYFSVEELYRVSSPTLFFNIQHINERGMEMPTLSKFTKASMRNEINQIIDCLHDGGKINYLPSLDDDTAREEAGILIEELFRAGFNKRKPVYVALDECPIIAPQNGQRNKAAIKLATRGLTFGLRGVFITQRPAEMHKTLLSQSLRHVIFRTTAEGTWFARYKVPHTEMIQMVEQGGEHAFILWDGIRLQGPYKV